MSYDNWKLASPEDEEPGPYECAECGYDDHATSECPNSYREEGCNDCDGFVYKGDTCEDCGLKGSITRPVVSTYRPESPFITLKRMEAKQRGYCTACSYQEHDVCSLTVGCPCCDDTIEGVKLLKGTRG